MRWLVVVGAVVVGLSWFGVSGASPVYFTVDTGMTAFKWGATATDLGFPHFDTPKWDVEPGFEWSPAERTGLWLRFSFRWQSLGRQAAGTWWHEGHAYVDGPRLGIHFRGRIVP